jgi:hypothetical protein
MDRTDLQRQQCYAAPEWIVVSFRALGRSSSILLEIASDNLA